MEVPPDEARVDVEDACDGNAGAAEVAHEPASRRPGTPHLHALAQVRAHPDEHTGLEGRQRPRRAARVCPGEPPGEVGPAEEGPLDLAQPPSRLHQAQPEGVVLRLLGLDVTSDRLHCGAAQEGGRVDQGRLLEEAVPNSLPAREAVEPADVVVHAAPGDRTCLQVHPAVHRGKPGIGSEQRQLGFETLGVAPVVGIHACDPGRPTRLQTVVERCDDPLVGPTHQAHPGVPGSQLTHPPGAVVRRPVVHDHQLEGPARLPQDALRRAHHGAAVLVERHEHRQLRSFGHGLPPQSAPHRRSTIPALSLEMQSPP